MEMKEKIDWMDEFVLSESYESAFALINKIDEVVRVFSGPRQQSSFDTLVANQEAFSVALTKLIMHAVLYNIDADTVTEGSEWKGMAGGFPKWKGQPGFSHLMWRLKELEQDIKESKAE
jgi:hypothetical protein|tara:strand:+ start:1265 stop:1621 length:357 start_codon:yes stop_codon:yes gene_type:complete